MSQTADDRGSTQTDALLRGGLVMLGLALLLSWLPALGPLIAGGVGGRVVGEPKRAVLIALVPAVLLAVMLWLLLAAVDLPVLGAVAGVGVLLVVAVQEIPLLVGAWFGAATAADPGRRV